MQHQYSDTKSDRSDRVKIRTRGVAPDCSAAARQTLRTHVYREEPATQPLPQLWTPNERKFLFLASELGYRWRLCARLAGWARAKLVSQAEGSRASGVASLHQRPQRSADLRASVVAEPSHRTRLELARLNPGMPLLALLRAMAHIGFYSCTLCSHPVPAPYACCWARLPGR